MLAGCIMKAFHHRAMRKPVKMDPSETPPSIPLKFLACSGAGNARLPIQHRPCTNRFRRNPLALELLGQSPEGLAPFFRAAVRHGQSRQLTTVGCLGLVKEAPVQPPAGKTGGGSHHLPARLGLLQFRRLRMPAPIELRFASAVPPELRQHHRLSGGGTSLTTLSR